MKKLKLNLEGAKVLSKVQQRSINGGSGDSNTGCNQGRDDEGHGQESKDCACSRDNDCASGGCDFPWYGGGFGNCS